MHSHSRQQVQGVAVGECAINIEQHSLYLTKVRHRRCCRILHAAAATALRAGLLQYAGKLASAGEPRDCCLGSAVHD